MDFKTRVVERLYQQTTKPIVDLKTAPKEPKAINLSEILSDFTEPVGAIIEDINDSKLNVIIDGKAIAIMESTAPGSSEKADMIRLLEGIGKNDNKGLRVDISSIKDLDYDKYKELNSHCKIRRVHINNGWDESAKQGMDEGEYSTVSKNANEMLRATRISSSMNEQEKFDRIYEYVVKNIVFDYGRTEDDKTTSRDFYGFFARRKSVCAGVVLGIVNLLEMSGIECEYVQGTSKSPATGKIESHSWLRVKIEGQWFNCDPTWDMTNKKQLNGQYAFKQLSDEDFEKDGMHTIDYSYNPTYIRTNDTRLRFYPERKQYEKAETSINPTARLSATETYLDKTREDRLAEKKAGVAQSLKSLLADTITFVFGKNSVNMKRLGNFVLNNATGLDAKTKEQYAKRAEQKQVERDEREFRKGNRDSYTERNKKIVELAQKDMKYTYSCPELMKPEEVKAEIDALEKKLTSRGVAFDSLKGIDIDTLNTCDKLRCYRGLYEMSRLDYYSYTIFDISNACERVNEIDPINMDRVISDEEIEELKIHAEISQQMERIKNDINNITPEQESFIKTLRIWGPTNETVSYMTELADMIVSGNDNKETVEHLRLLKDFVDYATEASEQESNLGLKAEDRRSDFMVSEARGKTKNTKSLERRAKKMEAYLKALDKKVDKAEEKRQKEYDKEQERARKEMERENARRIREAKKNAKNGQTGNTQQTQQTPDPQNAFVQNLQQQANAGGNQPADPNVTQSPQQPTPQQPDSQNR